MGIKKVTRRVTFFMGLLLDDKLDANFNLICASVASMQFDNNYLFFMPFIWFKQFKRFMLLV